MAVSHRAYESTGTGDRWVPAPQGLHRIAHRRSTVGRRHPGHGIVGLTAGALARLVVPGRQDISILMTIVLDIIGSFVGGFLGYLIFHKDAQGGFFQPSGIIGSFLGAVIVLLIYTRMGQRHTAHR